MIAERQNGYSPPPPIENQVGEPRVVPVNGLDPYVDTLQSHLRFKITPDQLADKMEFGIEAWMKALEVDPQTTPVEACFNHRDDDDVLIIRSDYLETESITTSTPADQALSTLAYRLAKIRFLKKNAPEYVTMPGFCAETLERTTRNHAQEIVSNGRVQPDKPEFSNIIAQTKRIFDRKKLTEAVSDKNRPHYSHRLLTEREIKHLPYPIDIKLQRNGDNSVYVLTRKGPRFASDTGERIYVIPTQKLQSYYAHNGQSQENLFQFLKENDLGGRRLSLAFQPVKINADDDPDLTIIVKTIQHESKNRWEIPDLARISLVANRKHDRITSFSYDELLVERDVLCDKGDPAINLSRFAKNAPVRIGEPWRSTLNPEEMNSWEYTTENQLEKSLKDIPMRLEDKKRFIRKRIEEEKENNDKLHLYHPNTNLLRFPLRISTEPISAYPVEALIYTDQETGRLKLQIQRTPTLYDRLKSLDPKSKEYNDILGSFPQYTSIYKLADESNGVNGISFDDHAIQRFQGENTLSCELLPEGKTEGFITLWFDAHTTSRREALVLNVFKKGKDTYMKFITGIETGETIGTGANAHMAFKHEKILYNAQHAKKSGADLEKLEKEEKEREQREKIKQMKKRVAVNPTLYE